MYSILLVEMLGKLDRRKMRIAAERIFAERAAHPFPPSASPWNGGENSRAWPKNSDASTSNAEEIEAKFAAMVEAIAKASATSARTARAIVRRRRFLETHEHLSPAERDRALRQHSAARSRENAVTDLRLEGTTPSAEVELLFEQFVVGELTEKQLLSAVLTLINCIDHSS